MVWSWSIRIGFINSCGLRLLSVFQDVLQRCICHGIESDCFLTRFLNPGITIGFGEVDHSHAGLIRLFFEINLLKQRINKTVSRRTDISGPRAIILCIVGTKCNNRFVILGHVIRISDITTATKPPLMDGNTFPIFGEDFNLLREGMDDRRLVIVTIRNRIIKAFVFQMIIVWNPSDELGYKGLKRFFGKRTQTGLVKGKENTLATTFAVFKIAFG